MILFLSTNKLLSNSAEPIRKLHTPFFHIIIIHFLKMFEFLAIIFGAIVSGHVIENSFAGLFGSEIRNSAERKCIVVQIICKSCLRFTYSIAIFHSSFCRNSAVSLSFCDRDPMRPSSQKYRFSHTCVICGARPGSISPTLTSFRRSDIKLADNSSFSPSVRSLPANKVPGRGLIGTNGGGGNGGRFGRAGRLGNTGIFGGGGLKQNTYFHSFAHRKYTIPLYSASQTMPTMKEERREKLHFTLIVLVQLPG